MRSRASTLGFVIHARRKSQVLGRHVKQWGICITQTALYAALVEELCGEKLFTMFMVAFTVRRITW